jgi:hypothetical protein
MMEDKLDKLIEYHQSQCSRFKRNDDTEQAAWHAGAIMAFSKAKDMIWEHISKVTNTREYDEEN